ncbi:MAG TPA: glycogen-binding domain-containing protein [Methylomirabilota bacterium]|nr:glycogen-binding domain-containing protein [Methylomirabilota bacterium]
MKSTKTKSRSVSTALFSTEKTATPPNGFALRLVAPAAQAVSVAGTFNNWQPNATPLKPASGGAWIGELKLAPGRYEYLFVVDGKWLPDPAARECAPNPFGGLNSVVSVN